MVSIQVIFSKFFIKYENKEEVSIQVIFSKFFIKYENQEETYRHLKYFNLNHHASPSAKYPF